MKKALPLLISLLSFAVFFGIAETIMRAHYGDGFIATVDPETDHARRPFVIREGTWGKGFALKYYTNSLGWRDKEPNITVPRTSTHRTRVVFLGDSNTEGMGYDGYHTFSGVAERVLNEQGSDVEILNGGTESFAPLPEYMRLKRFINEGYSTDYVVLLPDFSDVWDEVFYSTHFLYDAAGEPLRVKGLAHSPFIAWILNHSTIARSLLSLRTEILERRAANSARSLRPLNPSASKADNNVMSVEQALNADGETVHQLKGHWPSHEPSLKGWVPEGLRQLDVDITRIKKFCDLHHLPLLVVLYPWPQQLYVKKDTAYYEKLRVHFPRWTAGRDKMIGPNIPAKTPTPYETTIKATCQRLGIDVLDLYPEFLGRPNWHEFFIENDIHYNDKGNEIIGRKIAQFLRSKLVGQRIE